MLIVVRKVAKEQMCYLGFFTREEQRSILYGVSTTSDSISLQKHGDYPPSLQTHAVGLISTFSTISPQLYSTKGMQDEPSRSGIPT